MTEPIVHESPSPAARIAALLNYPPTKYGAMNTVALWEELVQVVDDAVAAEREACAQFIEKQWVDLPNSLRYDGPSYLELPDAIRARGGAGGAA